MSRTCRLTALKVARTTKRGRYCDGGGLYLQVAKGGSKAWLFRYERNGRPHHMGLGPIALVSLAEARQKALDARRALLEGIDPLAAKTAQRAAERLDAARAMTFDACADGYIRAHRAGWRSAIHAKQWSASLSAYATPVIGSMPVAEIDTAIVLKVLEPIWTSKPETAARVRGRIEAVLDWARARGFRSGENPARWKGHLDNLLPARAKVRTVAHHGAMSFEDVPAFLADLRTRDGLGVRALEFLVLTAARRGEIIAAEWSEIDPQAKVWTRPADKMKAGHPHRVPLCERAVEILRELPREAGNPRIFLGRRANRPLHGDTIRDLVPEGTTVHGFRAAFRDWCGERTNFPREVAEEALAHRVGDATERAYRRGDALEKRRALMEAWGRHCASPPPSGEVVPLRKGRTR